MTKTLRAVFLAGDCAAGALTGVATTLAVRAIVFPGWDMVAAMMLGMLAGTVVHLLLGVVLSPLLGMFETMVPGTFIGMYGGMLFAMRDSMQAVPLATALWVGAIFGIVVVLAVDFWNTQLRRQTAATALGLSGNPYPPSAGE
jgi:hypothetical protein